MKTAEKAMAEGVDYCGPVNMSHKFFCVAKIEKLTKDLPGGSYHVLKNTPRIYVDILLMTIGYTTCYRPTPPI